MNNIEKMRQEFEEKVELAEMENEFELMLGFDGLCATSKYKDGTIHVYFCDVHHKLTREDLVKILTTFPSTQRVKIGTTENEVNYDLSTHKYPKDIMTNLVIKWRSTNLDISVEAPINNQSDLAKKYFRMTEREIDDSTIGLYFGAVSPSAKAQLKIVRFLTFNDPNVIRFYGGTHQLMSESVSDAIIADIINGMEY